MTVAVVMDYVWLQYFICLTVTLFVCRLLLSALCRQQGAVCTLQCTVATVSMMMDEACDFSSYLFVCSSVCR